MENTHFPNDAKTRVTCGASREGLGEILEQNFTGEWRPNAYSSRVVNECEQRYSTNKLELLAVVWSVEHFRNYLYGRDFEIRTDHRALLSALKNNRGNKTQYSRLVRWVDRLLSFNFNIQHIPGKMMGWAEYLSQNPCGQAIPASEYDEKYVLATITRTRKLLGIENSSNQNAAQSKEQSYDGTQKHSKREHTQRISHKTAGRIQS